jgi:2-C-methyl-D-erythritol 4-phosphate cytidylyltransferase
VQHAESARLPDFPHLSIVAGGVERHDSVRSGLCVLPDLDLIAVHDAARPLAAAALLQQGVRLLDRSDGAVPALPVADTVKEISLEHMVVRTLDRSALRSVQTPQVFRGDALRVAHELAHLRKGPVTDDASLVEDRGFRVIVFPGHPRAFKITTEYDLRLARLLVAAGGDS